MDWVRSAAAASAVGGWVGAALESTAAVLEEEREGVERECVNGRRPFISEGDAWVGTGWHVGPGGEAVGVRRSHNCAAASSRRVAFLDTFSFSSFVCFYLFKIHFCFARQGCWREAKLTVAFGRYQKKNIAFGRARAALFTLPFDLARPPTLMP